jgi:hypothetical protein
VVWDKSLGVNGAWNADPCITVISDQSGTTCECEVFGTIAIVAEFIEEPSIPPEFFWLKIVKFVGFVCSLICTVIFVVTIAITP